MPGASVRRVGVAHERSGLAFAELVIGSSRHLAGCGNAAATPLVPGSPVTIITGSCLFGADAITGITSGGTYSLTDREHVEHKITEPITGQLHIDDRVHVYEAETAAEIGSFTRAIARQPGVGPVHVHAHIPGPEYLLYGISLYAQGFLSAGELVRYHAAVRRRAELVTGLLKEHSYGATKVIATSPMEWLTDLDVLSIPPDALAGHLYDCARQQDQLWSTVLTACRGSPFTRLAFASYIHHYIAAVQHAHRRRRQPLIVENPEEVRILRMAQPAARRVGVSLDQVPGFYLHPRVIVRKTAFSEHGRYLYHCMNGCEPRTRAQAAAARKGGLATTP